MPVSRHLPMAARLQSATFTFPTTVEVDNSWDNLDIAHQRANRIRIPTPAGVIHAFAGLELLAATRQMVSAEMRSRYMTTLLYLALFSVVPDNAANVFIADTFDNRVERWTAPA